MSGGGGQGVVGEVGLPAFVGQGRLGNVCRRRGGFLRGSGVTQAGSDEVTVDRGFTTAVTWWCWWEVPGRLKLNVCQRHRDPRHP